MSPGTGVECWQTGKKSTCWLTAVCLEQGSHIWPWPLGPSLLPPHSLLFSALETVWLPVWPAGGRKHLCHLYQAPHLGKGKEPEYTWEESAVRVTLLCLPRTPSFRILNSPSVRLGGVRSLWRQRTFPQCRRRYSGANLCPRRTARRAAFPSKRDCEAMSAKSMWASLQTTQSRRARLVLVQPLCLHCCDWRGVPWHTAPHEAPPEPQQPLKLPTCFERWRQNLCVCELGRMEWLKFHPPNPPLL